MNDVDPNKALQVGASAAQAIIAAKNGDAIGAAAHAMDAVLELLPSDDAKKLLDERALARAEAFREQLNDEKFGVRGVDKDPLR